MAEALTVRMRVLGARAAKQEVKGVRDETAELGATSKRTAEEQKTANEGVLGGMKGLIGLAAGAGVYEFFKHGVEGAMDLQKSTIVLNNSLANLGIHSKAVTDQFREQAEAASQRGGGTTEEELQAQGQFLTITKSVTAAQKANAAANDLARAKAIPYATAVKAITAAENGRTRGLAKYLGITTPARANTDKLTEAYQKQLVQQEAIAKGMGKTGSAYLKQWELTHRVTAAERAHATAMDQAKTGTELINLTQQKYAKSTESTSQRLQDMRHSFSNLENNLGQALIPTIDKLIKVGADLSGWLSKNKGVAEALGLTVAGLATVIIAGKLVGSLKKASDTLKISSLAAKIFGGSAEAAGTEAAAGADTARVGWTLFASSTLIGLLIPAVMLVVEHFQTVKRIAGDVVNWIGQHWKLLLSILTGPIGAAIIYIVTHFNQVKHAVSDVVHSIGHAFSSVFHTIISPFQTAINWIKGHAQDLNPMHWVNKGASGLTHAIGSLFSSGGTVPGVHPVQYHALGGPVGTDTTPMWGTPGEFVLPRSVVNRLGTQRLDNLVAGGSVGSSGEERIYIEPADLIVDGQRLARIILKVSKQRSARGSTNLVGGNLSTSGAVA